MMADDHQHRKPPTAPRQRPRPGPRPTQYRDWLRQMLLIRRFEEKAGEAYSLGKIGGFCHLYIGQEAVAVGSHRRAPARRLHHRVLPRARPGAGARHDAARGDGRAVRQGDGLLATARAARCTSSTPRTASSAATASSAGTSRSRPGMAFAIKYREHRPGRRLLLRRGGGQQRRLPRGAQHGRALEAARSSTSARTTATAWAPRSSGRSAIHDISERACSYDMATRWSTGRTCWRCTHAMERAVERARERQASHAARGPHLPLHGPLDVRPDPRALPHQGRGRGAAEARPDRRLVASGSSSRRPDRRGAASRRWTRRSSPRWRTRYQFAEPAPGSRSRSRAVRTDVLRATGAR